MHIPQYKIIKLLQILNDYYHIRSNSIVTIGSSRKNFHQYSPFRKGFLSSIDERTEIIKRLNRLEGRKKYILLRYYTFSKPISEISNQLKISQRHFYRLKKDALNQLTEDDD